MSMLLVPLEAYVAATSSSTFFVKPFDCGPRRLVRREHEARQHEADLRQVAHEDRRQIDDDTPPCGLIVRIGRLNSTLSV